MTLRADSDRLRQSFIDTRRALVDQAETVADGRRNGTLSAAALDRLVVDAENHAQARRAFILLEEPPT